jgi:hypothetical protein
MKLLSGLPWLLLVAATGKSEASSIQENYPADPDRVYDRLAKAGKEAGEWLRSNPPYTLYPDNGPAHTKNNHPVPSLQLADNSPSADFITIS